jgi:protein-tyrosine phosphatase
MPVTVGRIGLVASQHVSDWFERYGFAEVADGLLTGAYPTDESDVEALAAQDVTAIFNLCEDSEYAQGERDAVAAALSEHGIPERRLCLVDYGNLMPGHLEQATREVLEWLEGGERVYLHCRAGWQRSATVAAAVLALRDGVEPDVALASIRKRKPSAEPLAHQLEDLWRWWQARSVRDGA